MPRMRDVFTVFEEFSGQGWYPDPTQVAKSPTLQKAVEIVDGIIAVQAKGTHHAHCTAQERRDDILVPAAKARYYRFRRRLRKLVGRQVDSSAAVAVRH